MWCVLKGVFFTEALDEIQHVKVILYATYVPVATIKGSNGVVDPLQRQQGRSHAIRRVGSLRTKSGPSNSFYNYGDFKTCMS